ncbi:hypothetical protein [Paludisphaera soli]|uniref:hypothetical protein n=1 Tax=Paludisphaera soli TaxID=2712865 RepID=UPI0013EB5F9C|nr:hypothetical protein [Paludisphaera soli]
MPKLTTTQFVLGAAGIGVMAAVVTSEPLALLCLLAGGFLSIWGMIGLRGVGRAAPAAVLTAVVLGAHYAPVKTIERRKAVRIALPKTSMTVAELRDPGGHGLHRPSPVDDGYFHYFFGDCPEDLDGRVVRFPASELTVGRFIREIEDQTPLRHWFHSCGNAGWSILTGRNAAMGLSFSVPTPTPAPGTSS